MVNKVQTLICWDPYIYVHKLIQNSEFKACPDQLHFYLSLLNIGNVMSVNH